MGGFSSGIPARRVDGRDGPSHRACGVAHPPYISSDWIAIRATQVDQGHWDFPRWRDHSCLVSRKCDPKYSWGDLDSFSRYTTLFYLSLGMEHCHHTLTRNAR